jgi:hypothetical protein
MKITFFNQYHNGDCFVGKGWVRNIMNQLPDVDFYYAHANNPDIIKDLDCEYLPIEAIGPVPNMTRLAKDEHGNLYINTWCGAFQGELFGYDEHSNYIRQHIMYGMYCNMIEQASGLKVQQSNNPHDYLPFIDFSYYNTAPADQFVASLGGKDLIVVCNGGAMSGQSNMGNMKNIIDVLTQRFPEKMFVVTEAIDIRRNNLYTTGEIFNQASDLNEIAYLTKFAKMVIGKNSGPYSFSLFDDNMNDANKTFFCFGKKLTDCMNAGLEFPARFKFSDQHQDDFVINMLSRTLANPDSEKTGMQHITA